MELSSGETQAGQSVTHMKTGDTSITGLRPSASLSVPASGFRMKPKAEAVDSSSDCAATCAA